VTVDNNHKDSLYIPMGLKAESEIFSGFGKQELMKSLLFISGAAIAAVILYLFMRGIEVTIIFLFISVAASIGVFVKDATGNSVALQLGNIIRFMRSQKKYRYIQMDEWGIALDAEK
jgi:hypothetical protein